MKSRIFSGIQPSGDLHIGNYLGALAQWSKLQESGDYEILFCVVDLHAITVPQDPVILKKKIREVAALYIACGIDPSKSKIFIQSENPDHAYLTWIFDCITPMGWMERMTQYKDKSKKNGERTSVGLFNYPLLMASDILLYDPDLVPVGDDQKQHLELAGDVAEKFNKTFGEAFKIPKIFNQKETARIMSLSNPTSKMSKSDEDPSGSILLLDDAETIEKKVKRAVTDSGNEIQYHSDKPAISNLLAIYSGFSGTSIENAERKNKNSSYGEFKADLASVLVEKLGEIQRRFNELIKDEAHLNTVLDEGRDFAHSISSKKIELVKDLVGLRR
ncbi:tryptophan--tRNA ligase [Candidatus Roizmanbacteria bacterium RIFCSPLOWO2_02_FULL_39_8]|nr:MAG: tryptophan--tRNA ligase [Candidatus Roizmanbacteria bacterium RIFCSPLOWO2_02_FULL_39_8]